MSRPLKFGDTLKTLRQSAGLTMVEAEKISGMKPGRWEDLEAAEHEPRAGDLVRAMMALNVKNYRVFKPEDFERPA